MWRSAICVFTLLAFTLPAGADERPGEVKPARPTHRELLKRLAWPVNLERGIDPKSPFKDVIEHFSDRYDITIVVNSDAFRRDGIAEIEMQPITLPPLKGVPLKTVFRMVLAQVNASMIVTPELIEVIPAPVAGLPIVQTSFEDRPLDEILRELSERTDYTVVFDAQKAIEKANLKLTVNFKRVPLDTAVRLVADMAGLKMVTTEKALYVTDKANAEILQQEVERAEKKATAKEAAKSGM